MRSGNLTLSPESPHLRHLEEVLDPKQTGTNHDDATEGLGEHVAVVLQIRQDLHASDATPTTRRDEAGRSGRERTPCLNLFT